MVDFALLEKLGSAIASTHPPTKAELVACCTGVPALVGKRAKTGFTTPVRQWISKGEGTPASRGLRGWASRVHQEFRTSGCAIPAAPPIELAA
jgi:hypothetical protein